MRYSPRLGFDSLTYRNDKDTKIVYLGFVVDSLKLTLPSSSNVILVFATIPFLNKALAFATRVFAFVFGTRG